MESDKRLGDFFRKRREKGKAGLPLLSVTINNGLVHRDTLDRKTDTELTDEDHLLIRKGDIAYNMMRMWQGASGLADRDGLVSPAYVVVAPKEGIDPLFASYWFKSPRMIYLFWAYSYGLTKDRLRLYFNDFATVPAAPPEIGVQKRIAAVLRTFDEAIAQTEKLIAAKRRLKQGLMQQLLTGQRRFPEFANRRRPKETKWGPLPADWDIVHLDDVAAINQRTLPEATDPASSFFYVDLSTVKDGSIRKPSRRISFADAPSRARRLATRGDIVMATVRPNLQGFALPAFDLTDFVFSTGFAIISPQRVDDSGFLYHSLYSEVVARQLHGLIAGSSYPAITGKDVGRLRIFLPSDPRERAKIGRVLTALSHEINLLCKYARWLSRQKHGLMQKLLTGPIRVSTSEANS